MYQAFLLLANNFQDSCWKEFICTTSSQNQITNAKAVMDGWANLGSCHYINIFSKLA
jgi:hypothetical protein